MSETPSAPEEVHLNLLPGSSETQNNNNTNQVISEMTVSSCCNYTHRKLAIGSVICGISCIGIIALINSVKVLSFLLPASCSQLLQSHFDRDKLSCKPSEVNAK